MILGITGGVGSGKSTVLSYLSQKYDAKIIEADYVAKCIMNPGYDAYDKIIDAFPNIVLDGEGHIDRASLASIVFTDKNRLETLNSIVHPEVKKEIKSIIYNTLQETPNRLIVIEAALLIEDGYKEICDQIWYVYCELETRIQRLMDSRGYSRYKSISIINNQMSDEEYEKYTDAKIDNSNTAEECNMQIDKLLNIDNMCN